MLHKKSLPFIIRNRCLKRQPRSLRVLYHHAPSSPCSYSTRQTGPLPEEEQSVQVNADQSPNDLPAEAGKRGEGRMSSRLKQMTDESLSRGGRGAEKFIEQAGFSEELKKQLEERIKDSTFKSENPAAFAQMNMPVSRRSSQDISLTSI